MKNEQSADQLISYFEKNKDALKLCAKALKKISQMDSYELPLYAVDVAEEALFEVRLELL